MDQYRLRARSDTHGHGLRYTAANHYGGCGTPVVGCQGLAESYRQFSDCVTASYADSGAPTEPVVGSRQRRNRQLSMGVRGPGADLDIH